MQRLLSLVVFALVCSFVVSESLAQSVPQDNVVKEAADDKAARSDDEDNGETPEEENTKTGDSSKPKKSADDSDSGQKDEPEKPAGDEAEDDEEKPDDKPKKAKKTEKKQPKPHTVKVEKLKIEVELDGVFVANEMEEVTLRPEVWTRFKVLEAVQHGTEVSKGQVLVRFDDEDLEKDLSDEALDQNLGQLSLLQEEEEFPRVKRLLELSFENAERRFHQTKDDYDYYHSTDRPFTVQIANFRYKSAQEQLAAAEEELNQLQQMYEADELTEATEEIVLRRQRFEVETAKLILELNKESRDYTMNVSLPRSDEYYETSLEEAEIAFEQARTAVEMGATRKNYEMEKKRKARAKSVERHGNLLSDKGLMELRAPCDGVVYYGKCTNGKWSQINSIKAKLKPFGTVTANTTVMTIVKPGALHIESSLGEKSLPDVADGQPVTIVPSADKELEIEGKVAHVDRIPGASNKFKVLIEFNSDEAPEWMVAGMTCDANITVYENDEAIVVPQDLVQTDEDNEKIKYVMLVDSEEDEPVRRKVKVGRKKGKNVEVLKGLEEGDQIVKEDKKKDDE